MIYYRPCGGLLSPQTGEKHLQPTQRLANVLVLTQEGRLVLDAFSGHDQYFQEVCRFGLPIGGKLVSSPELIPQVRTLPSPSFIGTRSSL